MKGLSVKKSIKIAGKTIAGVAEQIGVTREHLGRLLGDDVDVDNVYLEKIKALGIEVKEIKSEVNPKESLEYLKAENFWLKQQVAKQESDILLLEAKNKKIIDAIEAHNKTLERNNITLNAIVLGKVG